LRVACCRPDCIETVKLILNTILRVLATRDQSAGLVGKRHDLRGILIHFATEANMVPAPGCAKSCVIDIEESTGWQPTKRQIDRSIARRIVNELPLKFSRAKFGHSFFARKAIDRSLRKQIAISNVRKQRFCLGQIVVFSDRFRLFSGLLLQWFGLLDTRRGFADMSVGGPLGFGETSVVATSGSFTSSGTSFEAGVSVSGFSAAACVGLCSGSASCSGGVDAGLASP